MAYSFESEILSYVIADSDHLYKSNMGRIITPDIEIFFDTSDFGEGFEKWVDTEEEKRKFLVISHEHIDHYRGGIRSLELFDTIICAQSVAIQISNLGYRTEKIHTLDNRESDVEIDGNVISLQQNCHTEFDLILYNVKNKFAFLGDILISKRHRQIVISNVENIVNVLKRLLEIGIEIFIPGHGGIMSRNEVRQYIKYLLFIRKANEMQYSRKKIIRWLKKEKCIEWNNIENLWF